MDEGGGREEGNPFLFFDVPDPKPLIPLQLLNDFNYAGVWTLKNMSLVEAIIEFPNEIFRQSFYFWDFLPIYVFVNIKVVDHHVP